MVLRRAGTSSDPFDELLLRHRPCKVEALALIAGEVTQKALALLGFDALGHQGEAERVRKLHS